MDYKKIEEGKGKKKKKREEEECYIKGGVGGSFRGCSLRDQFSHIRRVPIVGVLVHLLFDSEITSLQLCNSAWPPVSPPLHFGCCFLCLLENKRKAEAISSLGFLCCVVVDGAVNFRSFLDSMFLNQCPRVCCRSDCACGRQKTIPVKLSPSFLIRSSRCCIVMDSALVCLIED